MNSPFEPWPLDAPTAKVLGLPPAALTPTAQRVANGAEWLWFDPAAAMAIWQGPACSLANLEPYVHIKQDIEYKGII